MPYANRHALTWLNVNARLNPFRLRLRVPSLEVVPNPPDARSFLQPSINSSRTPLKDAPKHPYCYTFDAQQKYFNNLIFSLPYSVILKQLTPDLYSPYAPYSDGFRRDLIWAIANTIRVKNNDAYIGLRSDCTSSLSIKKNVSFIFRLS